MIDPPRGRETDIKRFRSAATRSELFEVSNAIVRVLNAQQHALIALRDGDPAEADVEIRTADAEIGGLQVQLMELVLKPRAVNER